jgi:hypothetical protein
MLFGQLSIPRSNVLLTCHCNTDWPRKPCLAGRPEAGAVRVPKVMPTWGIARGQVLNKTTQAEHDRVTTLGVRVILGNVAAAIVRPLGVTHTNHAKQVDGGQ